MKKGTLLAAAVLGLLLGTWLLLQFTGEKEMQELVEERIAQAEEEKQRAEEQRLALALGKPWKGKYSKPEKLFPDSLINAILETQEEGKISQDLQAEMNHILRETENKLVPTPQENHDHQIAIASFEDEKILIYYGGEMAKNTEAKIWGIRQGAAGELWQTYFRLENQGNGYGRNSFIWNDSLKILCMRNRTSEGKTKSNRYTSFWKVRPEGISPEAQLLEDVEWKEEIMNEVVACKVEVEYSNKMKPNGANLELECHYSIDLSPKCRDYYYASCVWEDYPKEKEDEFPIRLADYKDVVVCTWNDRKDNIDLKFKERTISKKHLDFFEKRSITNETTLFDKDIKRLKKRDSEKLSQLLKMVFGK